jgi:hypothetical protein
MCCNLLINRCLLMKKYAKIHPPLLYHTRKGMLPYLKIFFLCFFLSCFYVKMNKQIIIFIYCSISYHFCYKINTM